MNQTLFLRYAMVLTSLSAGLTGCGSDDVAEDSDGDLQAAEQALVVPDLRNAAGMMPHLSGISDTAFRAAQDNFTQVETAAADGVGPIMNESACGNCHTQGGPGGAGFQVEQRFGRFDNGVFNSLASLGGSLRQLMSNAGWKTGCNTPLEVEPAGVTVRAGRLTTPLFGLGLIDTIADSMFTTLANNEPFGQKGTVSMVKVLLPDQTDIGQSIGSNRVGRFGWKSQVPNIVQFAADAYVNEMGITTSHCFRGSLVTAFASESKPNGVAVPLNCEDGKPGLDDPATANGTCGFGQNAIQSDVKNFTTFMTFLKPPPVNTASGTLSSPDSMPGATVFSVAACQNCHTRVTFKTPPLPFSGVPGNFEFRPYSDFLLHDMGSLGDQIGNDGDSQATTRKMRTAPLWGLRFRATTLLHDGRATSVDAAIRAHDGQGLDSSNRYKLLPPAQQTDLINYLMVL